MRNEWSNTNWSASTIPVSNIHIVRVITFLKGYQRYLPPPPPPLSLSWVLGSFQISYIILYQLGHKIIIAANDYFHHGKIFANFATVNFFPVINTCVQNMTFTALVKIYSIQYFCTIIMIHNVLGRLAWRKFVQRKFSAEYIQY